MAAAHRAGQAVIETAAGYLAYYDGRDYALMLTVDQHGRVEIQHQADSDQVADRRMARLAAEIIDQIGPAPVLEQLGSDEIGPRDLYPMAVLAPEPGRAVMRCRCGEMLNLADMRRLEPPRSPSGWPIGAVIRPIVCRSCASEARP